MTSHSLECVVCPSSAIYYDILDCRTSIATGSRCSPKLSKSTTTMTIFCPSNPVVNFITERVSHVECGSYRSKAQNSFIPMYVGSSGICRVPAIAILNLLDSSDIFFAKTDRLLHSRRFVGHI